MQYKKWSFSPRLKSGIFLQTTLTIVWIGQDRLLRRCTIGLDCALYFRSLDSWVSIHPIGFAPSPTDDYLCNRRCTRTEQKGIVISRLCPRRFSPSSCLVWCFTPYRELRPEWGHTDGCLSLCHWCSKVQVVLEGTQVICIHLITKHRPMRSMRGVRNIFLYIISTTVSFPQKVFTS